MAASDHSPGLVWTCCCESSNVCYRSKPGFKQEFCVLNTAPFNEVQYANLCHPCAEYDVMRAVTPRLALPYCLCNTLGGCAALALPSAAFAAFTAGARSFAYASAFGAASPLLAFLSGAGGSVFAGAGLVNLCLCCANCYFGVQRRNASRELVGIPPMGAIETCIEVGLCDHNAVHQEFREVRARAALISGAGKGPTVERARTAGGSEYIAESRVERTVRAERRGSASSLLAGGRSRSPAPAPARTKSS